MKFKPGDKVRFLNDAVEGVVSNIYSKERVEVTDVHGFSHTTEEKYLVRIEFIPADDELDEEAQVAPKRVEVPVEKKQPVHSSFFKDIDEDQTIYAIVRLLNEDDPLTTDIELRIGNNTAFSVSFTIAKKIDDLRFGIDHGFLKPKTDHSVGLYSQDELHRFSGFEVQLLFSNDREYRPRPPAVKTLSFNSSDFLNPDFKQYPKGYNNTLLMPLYSFSHNKDIDVKGLLEKFREHNKEDDIRKPEKPGKKSAFTVLTRQKVVDLHIEELVKDYAAMTNAQIISYQLNYFSYEMDQAIIQKYHKIVFIHGVGQGILKNAIKEELKKYPGINFGEAPQEKYGYGATEVEFL